MISVLIGSIIGIISVAVLIGMSEIAQTAFATPLKISTKSGASACTECSEPSGKPFALAPPGQINPLSSSFASSGYILCGGKPGAFTKSNGITCAP